MAVLKDAPEEEKFMNRTTEFRYLPHVCSLQFDEARCRACGACLEVCPRQVFARQEQRVCVRDRDACIECGACARNCPHKALALTPGAGCATLILQQWLARWGWRRKGKSGCC